MGILGKLASMATQIVASKGTSEKITTSVGTVISNKMVSKCEEELKKMQKDLVHLLDNGEKEQYEITLSNYLKLKQEYENNPLYSNYMTLKEEVNDLIQNITSLISLK